MKSRWALLSVTRRTGEFQRGGLILLVVFVILFPLLFRPGVYGFDPVGYFSWVRSAVVDGDLDTMDEYAVFGNAAISGPTATGYNHNPYPVGTALLWTPFFLTAHIGENLRATIFNLPQPTGYETSYVFLVGIGSVIFGFTTILLLYGLSRRYFGKSAATLAALGGWLATPLVFYSYSHPTMAHAADAFVNTLVVLAWVALRRDTPGRWFVLGAATGLAMLVRTQNALLILVPSIVLFGQLMNVLRSRGRIVSFSQSENGRTIRKWLLSVGAYSLGVLLTFLPQLFTWRIVYGSWIVGNPYSYSDAGQFYWGRLWVDRVLFSTDRGLFIWSPIIALAVLGFVPLFRRDRRLAIFLTWSLIGRIMLVSMWSAPTGAISFGARLLLNNMPAYILGLAALAHGLLRRNWPVWSLGSVTAALIVWNFLLMAQYATGTIPRAGLFPIGDFIVGQFTVLPSQADRILQALITRQ